MTGYILETMRSVRLALGIVAAFVVLAGLRCADLASPAPDCAALRIAGGICITGTVRYYDFEGGFWAVRGDDGTTYDPLGGLPASFQSEGLRVKLQARIRDDVVSIHMAGRIVEILDIEEL